MSASPKGTCWPPPRTAFTVVIVGCGLIGGAAAKAIRRRWRRAHLVGVDRPKVLREAREAGAIDEGAAPSSLARTLAQHGPQLVILATPVQSILDTLETVRDGLLEAGPHRDRLVIDMGSVKGAVVDAAERVACPDFVGGHPMAGRESGGFAWSTDNLFEGATFVICGGSPAGRRRARGLAQGLGAKPLVMDAHVHDRCVSLVSHTTHLSAIALMQAARDLGEDLQGTKPAGLPFKVAAGSWRDGTRVAASAPTIWHDIVHHNRDAIVETLGAYIDVLQSIHGALARGEPDVLSQTVDAAALAQLRRKIATNLPPILPSGLRDGGGVAHDQKGPDGRGGRGVRTPTRTSRRPRGSKAKS